MIKEMLINNEIDYTVKIQASKIDSVRAREISKKGCRVFMDDGSLGMSATEGKCSDEILIQKAKNATKLGLKYNYKIEENKNYEGSRGNKELINLQYLTQLTETILKELTKLSNKIVISHQINASSSEIILTNDKGINLRKVKSRIEAGLILKILGSANIFDGFLGFHSYDKPQLDEFFTDADEMFKLLSLPEISLDSKNITTAFLNNEILNKFYSDINGNNYHLGSSLLSTKKGQKLFSEKISLLQKPICDRYFSFIPFDHEGYIHNEDRYLIRNGVLETILYDKNTAAKYNAQTTGNGFRSYSTNTQIHNLYSQLDCSSNTLKNIDNELILLPLICSGGDFLPNGDYTTPVQLGFIMKNGKIVGKAKQCTIKGNYLKALNENFVDIVENDLFKMFDNQPIILSRMEVEEN